MRATRNRVYGQPYQGFKSLRLRQDLYRNAVFFIEFLRILWYNYGTNTMKRTRCARLFLSRPAGFFIEIKGNTMYNKNYKTNDKNFDIAYEKLAEREGGYTDGSNQIDDEPTNMGITQSTLTSYSAKHPESNMPSDVKKLTPEQAREIYKAEYWDNTNIPQINNSRIRNAIFDMSVMSGPTIPTKTIQQTLNEQMNANLPETGYLGKQTITALNAIPDNKINDFMKSLINNRMKSLQTMVNWPTAKGGWTARTNRY